MTAPRPPVHRTVTYDGLLGTVIGLRIDAADDDAAAAVEQRVVDEIVRLQRVFSVYDPTSELCRWRSGQLDRPGPELTAVLAAALHWQRRSGGAFNPLAGALVALWREAESAGRLPAESDLAAVVAAIASEPYVVDGGVVRAVGDCRGVDLNAIAKGWIVDRALAAGTDAAVAGAVGTVVVNAGGDLLVRGDRPVRVGLENPHRPYDNEPPLVVLELQDVAIATSGNARRGFRIGARRYSHVLDPRTGRTVERTVSASVIAGDAATADAVATVVGVLEPDAALAFADALEGVACLLIESDRTVHRSRRWHRHEVG